MEFRNLGRSGLKVSKMSLGCNAFGGRADEATSIRVVHAALDSGINLIDTANVYLEGESERVVGKALKGRRAQAILATKAVMPMGTGPNDAGASRKHLFDALDASLKRLDVDHVDLYQVHRWDANTPLEETLGALDELVRSGKVRYIGCSNYTAWQIVKALGISERKGWASFISHQPEYSPVSRHIEREIVPAGVSEGVGQVVYFPLAGGLLTGKYKRNEAAPVGSRAETQGGRYSDRFLNDRNFDIAERLTVVASEAGVSLAHLTLAWVMAKPGIASAIVGATKPEQLLENVKACEVVLDPAVIQRVDQVTATCV